MLPGFLANLNYWRELPAAVSTATAAAIAAVTVPATATTATSTTTAATPTAAAKAATPTAASRPSSSAATTAFTRRTGFVNDNVAAHEIVAIQSLDSALGFLITIDLNKSEPTRLA
jgi:hypothetical protein